MAGMVVKASASLRSSFPYLAAFADPSPLISWQVPYAAATVLGAALSRHIAAERSVADADGVVGVSVTAAFAGGFLMLIGARMAGGCTSGHGLSGMAMLQAHSLVAVVAMFAGGIATALVLRGANSEFLVVSPGMLSYPGC